MNFFEFSVAFWLTTVPWTDPIGHVHNHPKGMPNCYEVTLTSVPEKLALGAPYARECVIEVHRPLKPLGSL